MFQIIRNYSNRVPMIKFRQGKMPAGHDSGSHIMSQSASGSQAKSGSRVVSGQIIEDWQLPRKYKRRAISEEECMAINMGGAV